MANTKIPAELSSTPSISDSGDATAITIDSSENVGIGTSSPDKVLVVADNGSNCAITLYKSPDGSLNSDQKVIAMGTGSSSNNSGTSGGTEHGILQMFHNGTEEIRLYTQGNSWVTNNFGIGTTSPAGLLTIAGSGDAIRIESSNSGAGGAQMDMLHFSSSPADGDVHGVINFGGYYSGSNSVYGSTFESVWSDVSAQQARLEFWTRNGSDYLQRFRIDHLGQLFAFTLTGSSASNPTLKINTSSGYIYYDSSSLRYKENIQDFPNSLNVVKDLRPVTFIDKKLEKSSFGLIAEEVDEIAPELVTYKEIDGKLEPETVVYDKLTIHLLKAIQEQQTIIEDLKARIETLEG